MWYRAWLSAKKQTELQFIELLNQDHTVLKEELCQSLQINLAAVNRLITTVNEANEHLSIAASSSHVELQFAEGYNINHVYSDFLNQERAFAILEKLFYHSYPSYEALGQEVYLSRSSLIRKIKQMNPLLKKYKMQISANPVAISGDEQSILQLFIIFFSEKYLNDHFPENKNLYFDLHKIAVALKKMIPKNFHFIDIKRIIIILYVHYVREATAHHLPNSPDSKSFFETFDVPFQNLIQSLPVDHSRYMDRLAFQYKYLFSKEKSAAQKQLEDGLLKLFEAIFDRFGYPKQNLYHVFPDLTVNFLLGRNLHVPYSILNDRLSRFESYSTNISKSLYRHLENEYSKWAIAGKTPTELRELYYLFSTFFPDFEDFVIRSFPPPKIMLQFSTDFEQARYMEQRLQREIYLPIEIQQSAEQFLFSETLVLKDYDLLISNVPKSHTFHLKHSDSVKYICLDINLNRKYRQELNQLIEDLYSKKICEKLP